MTGTVRQVMCSLSYDSFTLNKWIEQNREFLLNSRIQKIQQPTRRDFVFSIRNKGETQKLYININPQFYHVCFMNKESEKERLIEIPQKPPMFCMLLRKYLENALISKVEQPGYERILELYIETYNELSEKIYLCLAIELMGKHSNVILYNYDTNIILGCAHNVGAEKSRERELAGTLPYIYPPNPPKSWYISDNSFTKQNNQDINALIDNYYSKLINEYKFQSSKEMLKQIVFKDLKKHKNSYDKMNDKLNKESNSDKYRLYGDLIMANLYSLKDFSKKIEVFDWEHNQNIEIELDDSKTLKENANVFYKQYNKSKHSILKLTELIEKHKAAIDYCEQLLYSIDIASSMDELIEIKNEIEPDRNFKPIKSALQPLEFEIDGCKVYVGRNNRQNDFIVSKLSKDEDYWFHTKDCAGSHVLLKCENPAENLIFECAKLAKEYSKGKLSSKIGVIYTKRKNLKKPPHANPGYVTYKGEKEIIV